MPNIEFSWPYAALLLLFLLPLWWQEKIHVRDQNLLFSPIASILALVNQKRQRSMLGFFNPWPLVFWSLMVLALMRPQLVGKPIEVGRNGRSIMMVLDISESMDTADMVVDQKTFNRLMVAKAVMSDFIDQRRGDRIGLVVFGSEPFLHAPLSFDHPTIKQFLQEALSGFAGPKTAIGDAIGLGVKKLMDEPGDRVMILLTDGQNNEGSLEPLKAAEIAKKQGIKLYIAGLGASRIVVNGFFGATAVNPSMALDEAEPELENMASLTGGKYFRAKDADGLMKIYQEIDKLEPIKADPIVLIPRKELFYWPLALMVALMLLKILWAKRKIWA